MRMYADNGGVQQNQLLIPNLPRSNREAQCQTHPAQSVYTDISANNSAEEFNGNFTSIDTEVVRLLSINIFPRDILKMDKNLVSFMLNSLSNLCYHFIRFHVVSGDPVLL